MANTIYALKSEFPDYQSVMCSLVHRYLCLTAEISVDLLGDVLLCARGGR